MTHSIDAPLPPPTASTDTGGYAPVDTGSPSTGDYAPVDAGSPSTKDVAKDEAANVKDSAAQAGGQVASTAVDHAKGVAQETQRQAQDLLEQGKSQLKEQTATQQQKAAQGLTSLADELRGLADGSSEGAPGPARDLLQQASGMVDTLAGKLQDREPGELLEEVRAFARRKPGMFLLGAAAAGVLAGRLTSGVRAAHSEPDSGAQPGSRPTNHVDPTPADAGYGGDFSGTADTSVPAGAGGAAYASDVSPGTGAPLPPPPYGTVPPAGSVVPPTTPAGWDDPARSPGQVR